VSSTPYLRLVPRSLVCSPTWIQHDPTRTLATAHRVVFAAFVKGIGCGLPLFALRGMVVLLCWIRQFPTP
jgi:hypothetical protein